MKLFEEFSNAESEDVFIECVSEDEEKQLNSKEVDIESILSKYNIAANDIKQLKNKKLRNEIILKIRDICSFSCRELGIMLGVS